MTQFLETTIDKFIFRVAADRYYSREGLWVQAEGDRIRIGLSDFIQQRSGDIAFAEVRAPGTTLEPGQEVASIETIKVTLSLGSPVAGSILEVNPAMSTMPEVINQDPYGQGWLAILEAASWEADRSHLLEAQAYFDLMKSQAEEEINHS